MKKLVLGGTLLLCCSMSFGTQIDIKQENTQNVEKITVAFKCEDSKAVNSDGEVIASGRCCADIPAGTPYWAEVATIISLRLCAESARDKSIALALDDSLRIPD